MELSIWTRHPANPSTKLSNASALANSQEFSQNFPPILSFARSISKKSPKRAGLPAPRLWSMIPPPVLSMSMSFSLLTFSPLPLQNGFPVQAMWWLARLPSGRILRSRMILSNRFPQMRVNAHLSTSAMVRSCSPTSKVMRNEIPRWMPTLSH